MKNIALIIAGGVGSRLNPNIPKQFITVDNKPIIIYTIEKFDEHPNIDEIYIVCLLGWENILQAYINQFNIKKVVKIIPGGTSGFESIRNGIKEISNKYSKSNPTILIHDGNRPNVASEVISDVIVTCTKYGSAVPVTKINEVILIKDDQTKSHDYIDRDSIVRTQTPQAYPLDKILDAHQKAIDNGILDFVATCDLLIRLGDTIYFSIGKEENFKITTEEDLKLFKAIIERDKK